MSPSLDRVVVVGGSIAGLAAAAVLSSRCREVVVVERRAVEPGGSAAPQGRLPHVMLAAGNRVLEDLFPGFAAGLLAAGAPSVGTDPTSTACYWAAAGTVRDRIVHRDLGFPRSMCSRALVETHLRAAVVNLANVHLLVDRVEALLLRSGNVSGVRLRDAGNLDADLVVDASGRDTRVDDWLGVAGLPALPSTDVSVDLRYTGYLVSRRPGDFDGGSFAVVQNTPAHARIGVALPKEGNLWMVVLGGYFGVAAPSDPDGASAYAATLATPALASLLTRPHEAPPTHYTFRSSHRRHWDRLRLKGLCGIGDSVASFNPIYGQGMSSALLQAEALGQAVDRHGDDARLARAAAKAAAAVVDRVWMVATGGDFVYPATVGARPPGTALVSSYVERLTHVAASDQTVNRALTEVQQLLAPPATLFRPQVLSRVLARPARRPSPPRAAAAPGYEPPPAARRSAARQR